jgi:acyl carrier protein
MPGSEDVLAEIQRILVDDFNVLPPVRPEVRLVRDLHLDSMELTALAVGLERRFGVSLTLEETVGVSTVADLAGVVSSRMSFQGRSG